MFRITFRSLSNVAFIGKNKIGIQNFQILPLKMNRLTFGTHYAFSRKKKQSFDKKLDQSVNKQYKRINKRHFPVYGFSDKFKDYVQNYSTIISTVVMIITFIYLHIAHSKMTEEEIKAQKKRFNIQRRFNIIPENKIRDIIQTQEILNSSIEILRMPTRINYDIATYCILKNINKQEFACEINDLKDFLTFLEAQPRDFKVSFEYQDHKYKLGGPSLMVQVSRVVIIFGLIFVGGWIYKNMKNIFKAGGSENMFDLDSKKIEAIKPENINTLFKDVAGMHEAKYEITQFVDFLKAPQKYIEMGAKVPKGALLTGPPGTGKTLLARACAGEAGVPFYYISGSDFVQKYVGLGASRVRKLFNQAQKNAPSIIFIDEIDAIGKKRDSGPFANEQRDNTLNQLLVRMDGFDSKNKVIVMAATNIKDTLDPALLRPGRFDRSVQIGLPNFEQRKQILQVHLQKIKFDPQYTIEQLSNKISILTPGFSGAELANVCNQAAILAARENHEKIDLNKFQKATQRVMAGLEKRNLFSKQQKIMLAYYESGKAVVGWFTQGSDPIIKLSILPFSKASKGYSHAIKDQLSLNTKEELLGKICFYLAGRASENYFQSYVTTNGDADLKRAKRIINLLVTKFGMSEKLKHLAFPDTQFVRKPYSPKIELIIDEQIEKITKQCKQRVEALIIQKKDLIEKLKTAVLQKETINHAEIKEILGQRPFESNENYQKYIIEEQKSHQAKQKLEAEEKLTPFLMQMKVEKVHKII